MGKRRNKQEMIKLKKDLNTDRLWSHSRIDTYHNCSYAYFLKYVKNVREQHTSIYSYLGGAFHDILEELYNNKCPYNAMIGEVDNILLNADISDMKFVKKEEEKHNKIRNKYYACIQHFFNNHVPIKQNILTEKEILVNIKNQWFIGYIDAVYKDGDTYHIIDYKTSTMFPKSKIEQKGKQLTLYALYLIQNGIPVNRIKIKWNFLKYLNVSFTHNGKEKNYNYERHIYVSKLARFIKQDLKALNYNDTVISSIIEKNVEENTLKYLPLHIQDKYIVNDCYVDIPLTEETINNLKEYINFTILNIFELESNYAKTREETPWLKHVCDKDSYWCTNICGYGGHCRCFAEYMKSKNLYQTEHTDDVSFLSQLGLV